LDAVHARDDPGVTLPIGSLEAPVDSEPGEQVRGENRAAVAVVVRLAVRSSDLAAQDSTSASAPSRSAPTSRP
ncbi:MAG: hypothetical protein ACLGIK_16240, partial [Gemmatimonadota bacterium]